MNELILDYLLEKEEQEFLDFKQEHYNNNASFIHDILCLSNAEYDGDRYIIFGIEDKTKKIVGIENDRNRKNLQNFIDLIRSSNFNNQPTISLNTLTKEGQELDILTILNKKKRPYFLLKDKQEGKTTVRAGVVYTRDGDCNTPINSTADTAKIETIWREHFGLDLTPLERFEIYIQEHDMWLKQPTSVDKAIYYYKQHPEFTIEIYSEDDCQKNLDWYNYKPAVLENVRLSYFHTILSESIFYMLDKERCFFPFLDSSRYYVCEIFPEKTDELDKARWYFETEFYFALKDDLSYDIYNLFRNMYNHKTIEEFASSCWAKMPIYTFNNLEEAKVKLKELGIGKIGIPAEKY